MNRILPHIIALLCLTLALPAQNGDGPKPTPPQQDPPKQEQLQRWLMELMAEENRYVIARRLGELGGKGEQAQAAICGLLSDEKTRPVLFEGILDWIAAENIRSPAAVKALLKLEQEASPEQRVLACRAMEALDRRSPSLFSQLLEQVRDPENADRATWVAACEFLSRDEPGERARLCDTLIGALEAGADNGFAESAVEVLYRLSLHRMPDAAAWRRWYDQYFEKNGAPGFRYHVLAANVASGVFLSSTAVRLEDIELFIKSGTLPRWFLSHEQHPNKRVRLAAVGGLLEAAGEDPKKREDAATLLLTSVDKDPEVEIRRIAARDLVKIAAGLPESAAELKAQVAEVLARRLADADPATVRFAVQGIGRCGTKGKGYGDSLATVYGREDLAADAESGAAIRSDVIFALAAVGEGTATIVAGLKDPDLAVQRGAAAAIRTLGDPQNAVHLAEAWDAGQEASYRRDLVLGIESLRNFRPAPVLASLVEAVKKGDTDATPAVRALFKALRATGERAPEPAGAKTVSDFLVSWIPSKMEPVLRESIIKSETRDLTGSVGPVLVAWAIVEAEPKLRTQLVAAIGGAAAKLRFAELEALLADLESKEAWSDAEGLLSALISIVTATGQPPEMAARRAALEARLVRVLSQQSKHPEAEKLLSEQIDAAKENPSYELFYRRAQTRRAQGTGEKNQEALADLEQALKLAGEDADPKVRKAMLIEAAGLERDLGKHREAYVRATTAERIPGPDGGASLVRVQSGLLLRDPDALGGATAAYDKLVKASGTAGLSEQLQKAAAGHVAARDLVVKLDAGGPDVPDVTKQLGALELRVAAPWLLRGISEAAPEAIRRRLQALNALASDKVPVPAADATAEALAAAAKAAAAWWAEAK